MHCQQRTYRFIWKASATILYFEGKFTHKN